MNRLRRSGPGIARLSARFPDQNGAASWWWTAAGAVVTLTWLVGAVLTDALPTDVATASAAAATATAALVTIGWAPGSATVEAILASGVALVALPTLTAIGLDGPATDPTPAFPVVLLAVAVAVLVAATLPAAPRQARFLVAPAMLLAVPAAQAVDEPTAVAVVAAAAALAATWWSGIAALPLGLLAVAVTAVPDAGPAAALLAGAAVLATAAPHLGGGAMVIGLPGAVAAAAAIAAGPVSVVRVAATVALAGVAVLATTHAADLTRRAGDHVLVPAAALAAWLVVAPGTWTWAGDSRLRHYDVGALRGLAVAALVLLGKEAWVRRRGPVASTDELP